MIDPSLDSEVLRNLYWPLRPRVGVDPSLCSEITCSIYHNTCQTNSFACSLKSVIPCCKMPMPWQSSHHPSHPVTGTGLGFGRQPAAIPLGSILHIIMLQHYTAAVQMRIMASARMLFLTSGECVTFSNSSLSCLFCKQSLTTYFIRLLGLKEVTGQCFVHSRGLVRTHR